MDSYIHALLKPWTTLVYLHDDPVDVRESVGQVGEPGGQAPGGGWRRVSAQSAPQGRDPQLVQVVGGLQQLLVNPVAAQALVRGRLQRLRLEGAGEGERR